MGQGQGHGVVAGGGCGAGSLNREGSVASAALTPIVAASVPVKETGAGTAVQAVTAVVNAVDLGDERARPAC